MTASNYSLLTPSCDLGKKQPNKKKVAKLLDICRQSNTPVRKRINPGFATQYSQEFLIAFREICEIYAASNFQHPARQVLILMLDNRIYPCRADKFSEDIVKRLSGSIL